eukprot:gene39490-6176_t
MRPPPLLLLLLAALPWLDAAAAIAQDSPEQGGW